MAQIRSPLSSRDKAAQTLVGARRASDAEELLATAVATGSCWTRALQCGAQRAAPATQALRDGAEGSGSDGAQEQTTAHALNGRAVAQTETFELYAPLPFEVRSSSVL